uniref:Intracellular proteinase inhibitor BsuPI domain-containing protein n=1 Tax=Eubacterium cellulosolvens (strain ATCC 43171 / JCM 9499 / 6) TaxID=633697 RepID=I5AQ25_EUBC6
MNRKPNILAAFLVLALALLLTACGAGGDRVVRFAEANLGSGENIAIPGYEKLDFAAGKTAQTVNLKNPTENACAFVLTLTLEDGEALWTGKALSPGEAFTRITLTRALDAGEYPATLHYDCYTIEDNQPLNGAEIQLTLEVK